MYPWYREAQLSVGQLCSPLAGPTPIKTENNYSDCMLAVDFPNKKPSNAFPWLSEATNNNDYTKGNNNHHGTPPHLHPHPHLPHHHHHHHHPHHSHHPHLPHPAAGSQSNLGAAPSSSLSVGNCRHGHPEDTKCRSLNCGPPQSPSAASSLAAANEGATPDSSSTTATATAIPNFNQMPVPGGVQGQNPTQGLVHWMSAVMAEHMTSNPHHDPAAVGMHYMWNGPVEQCGQHTKDMDTYGGWPAPRNPMAMKQGYEAKMNPVDHHHHHHHHHHNNLQKGHMIDDGRLLDHHTMQTGAAQMSQLYGARGSSSSSSPGGGLTGHGGATNPATALLVVPQPINATKIGATGLPNGTGRKYQCKMCPQLEGRVVEYSRPGGGLDYHNSPLIGEIAAGGDYSQFHRSIDQLRSLNERGILASASNTQLTVTFTPIQNNGNNPTVLGYNQQQQQQQQLPVQQVQQLQHQQHPQLPQHHLQQQQQQPPQQQQNQKPFLPNGIVPHHEFPLKPTNTLNTIGGVPGNISLAVNGLLVGSNGVPLVDDRLNNNHLGVDSSNHRPNGTVNPSGSVVGGTTTAPVQRANGGGPNHVPVSGIVGNNVPSSTNGGGPSTVGGGVSSGPTNSTGDQIDLELKQFIVEKKELDSSCPPSPTNSVLLMQQQQHLLQDSDDLLDSKDSKIFTSKADLQLHTQIHMREAKPYKCSQCNKAFANSSYLSQHTRIHLGIKPYRCEICQRKFTQLSHLQQHIRTHTGDKPYKCRHSGCLKAFSQLSNLQSHSRCHQTDKPFKCNSCYKCFSDEPSLLEHIPKHKESKHLKTHICQYCGKSYTQETYLSKHMQKHSERTDKRPPIGTRSSNSTVNLSASTPGSSSSSASGSASNGPTTTVGPATMTGESTFWPKVSPDSAAATINDVINQQNNHHDFSLTPNGSATNGSNGSTGNGPATNGPQSSGGNAVHGSGSDHPGPHHQREDAVDELVGTGRGPPDNAVNNANTPNGNTNAGSGNQASAQQQQQQQQQQQPPPQQHNGTAPMNGNLAIPPVSTPMSASYDSNSIAKATSNSAFTPINAMPPHLNSLQHHHQLATQRPSYLYDAISFQNQKAAMAQSPSNAFPNQLISLHQIRNYAHQPAGGLMAGEHLLGVTVGPGGKDKG